jgi:general secretion pathway protein C
MAELDKGIKKTGEHTFEVQRGTVDSLLGNMSVLSRSARIVPEIKDGRAAGFRLFSVRPDGPFAKIGLQNGDVISAINGLDMTSPDKALEVYTKLKSASHLSVGLERNGQKITKEYNIR